MADTATLNGVSMFTNQNLIGVTGIFSMPRSKMTVGESWYTSFKPPPHLAFEALSRHIDRGAGSLNYDLWPLTSVVVLLQGTWSSCSRGSEGTCWRSAQSSLCRATLCKYTRRRTVNTLPMQDDARANIHARCRHTLVINAVLRGFTAESPWGQGGRNTPCFPRCIYLARDKIIIF